MGRMLDWVPKDLGLCLIPADSKPETEHGNVAFSESPCSSNEIVSFVKYKVSKEIVGMHCHN